MSKEPWKLMEEATKLLISEITGGFKTQRDKDKVRNMIIAFRDFVVTAIVEESVNATIRRIDKGMEVNLANEDALKSLLDMRLILTKRPEEFKEVSLGDELLKLFSFIENIGRIHAGSDDLLEIK